MMQLNIEIALAMSRTMTSWRGRQSTKLWQTFFRRIKAVL